MRHRKRGKKLSRKKAHRDKLVRNLVTQIFEHGRIKTTLAKAKLARPAVDKAITTAKKNTPADKERLAKYLFTDQALDNIYNKYFEDFKKRESGYSRLIRLSRRGGDNSKMAYLDLLVDDELKQTKTSKSDSKDSKKEKKEEKQKDKKSFWDRFSSQEGKKQDKNIKESKAKANLREKESTQRTTSK